MFLGLIVKLHVTLVYKFIKKFKWSKEKDRARYSWQHSNNILIELSFQRVTNELEEIHHENARNIIADESVNMKY